MTFALKPSALKELVVSNVKESTTILICLVGFFLFRYYTSPWRNLPPGPPGLPLLGNIFAMKQRRLWLALSKWGDKYGPILHINVLGQPLILLSSHKVAADLLERKAAIYSDRPRSIVATEMMTGGLLFGYTSCTGIWKKMRKAARESLNQEVIKNDHQIVFTRDAIELASSLIADRDSDRVNSWNNHIHRTLASSLVSVIYDKEPFESTEDTAFRFIDDLTARFMTAALPGAHFVEIFTWMRYIPARFAAWKRVALAGYEKDEATLCGLFDRVRQQEAEGSERPSLAATLIRDQDRTQLSDVENIWTAGSVYLAGDTSAKYLQWWMAAMVAYPETQKRAQQELDEVVGRERLPSFDDYEKLPYIQSMVKEVLRWAPVMPLGIPHRSIQDDWYDGYFIPKHSIMIPFYWSMNRNNTIYGADAGHFNPARFLDVQTGLLAPAPPDTKEEGHVTFGFGRRTCIGTRVAKESMFISIAVVLWALNVECAVDEFGNKVEFDVTDCIDDGLSVRPVDFRPKITPRFPDAISMLESAREN